jgi:hypothetical protein
LLGGGALAGVTAGFAACVLLGLGGGGMAGFGATAGWVGLAAVFTGAAAGVTGGLTGALGGGAGFLFLGAGAGFGGGGGGAWTTVQASRAQVGSAVPLTGCRMGLHHLCVPSSRATSRAAEASGIQKE